MHKLLQTSAWVMALILAIGMIGLVGCGDDDDDDDAEVTAAITATNPADGGNIAAGGTVTITFDEAATGVMVNGVAAAGAGKNWSFVVPEADAGQTKAYTITLDNGDGGAITLNVGAIDRDPPVLDASDLEDGDEDVEYEGLEEIKLMFSEPLDTVKSRAITIAPDGGDALKWSVAWEDGDATAVLSAGKGATLGAETTYVISGNIADPAGNEGEVDITFTTRAKE
jgi:hypothetical protein